MSAPKKKHRISSVLEFIGRTIFYLALLGNGAQANLPTSSISNLKPLFRNETLCAINTCDALCSTDSGQPPGAASNIKIPNAAVMANATFDDFDESSPIKVDMAGVANRTRRPQKRTLIPVPELCDRRQYVRVLSNFVARERQWVRHDRGGNESRTTTGAWAFPDSGKSAVGVDELTGCTAVAVISSKGVFLSHSWESPFFRTEEGEEQDDESFLGYTYNAILEGNLVGLRALTARGRIHAFCISA
ncbi:hypothetical protein EV356DRAFT_503920 [Viridothelium virens]|uniref:Uncharacterized protein n=1 Tax=Viridothelium virens TaxID=1048519 RepID=A0A6A6H4Y6_VIRVR|nr:hypothetical protein EV356DRAFT_503920 [Viridothelium virens]